MRESNTVLYVVVAVVIAHFIFAVGFLIYKVFRKK